MSILSDDEVRRAMRAQGVPDRLIEKHLEYQRRGVPSIALTVDPAPPPKRHRHVGMRDEARLEKEIVAHADKQLRALGFVVVNLSQARPSKITAGIPDRRYYHPARGVCLWWEAKTPTGRQSPAQRQYQEWCDACGDVYVLGTDQVLYDWLVAHGVAAEEGGLLIPLPYQPRERSA